MTLEERADSILRRAAADTGVSFRKLGLIDERRARTIREHEISLEGLEERRSRRQ
jgi:hypothetical protein